MHRTMISLINKWWEVSQQAVAMQTGVWTLFATVTATIDPMVDLIVQVAIDQTVQVVTSMVDQTIPVATSAADQAALAVTSAMITTSSTHRTLTTIMTMTIMMTVVLVTICGMMTLTRGLDQIVHSESCEIRSLGVVTTLVLMTDHSMSHTSMMRCCTHMTH